MLLERRANRPPFGYQVEAGYSASTYRLKILGKLADKKYLYWDGFCAWHPLRNAILYVSQGTGGAVAHGLSINRSGDMVFDVLGADGSVTSHFDRDSVIGPIEFVSESFRLEDGKWAFKQRLRWKRDGV